MTMELNSSWVGNGTNDTSSCIPNGTNNIDWFSHGILVLLLRAGFVLIHISSVPTNNVSKVLVHYLFDFAISTPIYLALGYGLAFGEDVGGLLGIPGWTQMHPDLALLGWSTSMISGAIFMAGIAGRVTVIGQMMASALFAAVVQPLTLHWVRCSWLKHYHGLAATAHHATGGTAALVGTIFLGKRHLLLRELDDCTLPPNSPANAFAGYMMVLVGLQAIAGPTITILSNMAAASGGALAVLVLQKTLGNNSLHYWKVVICFHGAMSGVVTVAAGLHIYQPLMALALGSLGAMMTHTIIRMGLLCFLEDYVNVVPVHLVCSVIGTLFSATFSADVAGMAVGIVAIIGHTAALLVPLFLILMCFGFLRDEMEARNHLRAVRYASGSRSWLRRILKPYRTTSQPVIRPGMRGKDASNILDTIAEEPAEIPDAQGGGEPNERVQTPAAADEARSSWPQNVRNPDHPITTRDRPGSLTCYKIHLLAIGREPSSKAKISSSRILEDSITELVECDTPENRCASQKLHQMCFLKSDDACPADDHSSVHISDTEATIIPLDEQGTPSSEKRKQSSISFLKWIIGLTDEKSKHDMDQNAEEKFEETIYMARINTENLEGTTDTFVSETSLDTNRDASLTESNSKLSNIVDIETNPESHSSRTDNSVNNTADSEDCNVEILHPPNVHQRCTSEQNLSTPIVSNVATSKSEEISHLNLTPENKLQTKSVSMKSQLEESTGDSIAITNIEAKSEVPEQLSLNK